MYTENSIRGSGYLQILEIFFIRTAILFLLCPALRVRSNSASFYPAKQAAPRTARHVLAKETGKFSPENLRDKMPRRAFYPALQGSGGPNPLHCFATATPPFQSGVGCRASTPCKSQDFKNRHAELVSASLFCVLI